MTRMNRAEDELLGLVESGLSRALALDGSADGGPELARAAYTLTPLETKVYPVVLFNPLGWTRREVESEHHDAQRWRVEGPANVSFA